MKKQLLMLALACSVLAGGKLAMAGGDSENSSGFFGQPTMVGVPNHATIPPQPDYACPAVEGYLSTWSYIQGTGWVCSYYQGCVANCGGGG